jgi:hypothetical protein
MGWNFVESVQRNPETNFAVVGWEFSTIKRVEQINVHVSSLYALLQTTHSKTYSYTSWQLTNKLISYKLVSIGLPRRYS